MTTIPLADLWHRTGRAARDDRKRLLSLYGVLLTPVALVVASIVYRLLCGESLALGDLRRPVAYVVAPLRDAWMADQDLSLLLFVVVAMLAWGGVWGLLGGAVSRMAAVHIASGRREPASEAFAFARRHAAGFSGARAVLAFGVVGPLALGVLAASAARLPGWFGSILTVPGLVVAVLLALVAVVAGSLALVAGFLSTPTIAVEDSDAFDAVSRVFGYAGAGLPRLMRIRLVFLAGVVLGVLWRGLRTAVAFLVGALVIHAGAGRARFERWTDALGTLGAGGDMPPLADLLPGLVLAALAGGLVALWLADAVTRVLCARVGAFLALRQEIDRIPADRLRTAPTARGRVDAEEAGFVEVGRIGSDAAARAR